MQEIVFSEIPGDAVRASLSETIEKELNTKEYDLKLTAASKVGEHNMLGVIYRASFNKKNETKSSKLILKVAPQNPIQREQLFIRPAFLQEMLIYETVGKFIIFNLISNVNL